MHNVIAIANYFIKKGIETQDYITHMKLQKLLYFSHGWYLALKNTSLLDSSIEAWEFGPVIPTVYEKLKHYGNKPITEPVVDHNGNIPELYASRHEDTIKFLEQIWNTYHPFNAFQLSEMTHEKGSPWDDVAKQYEYRLPRSKDIDDKAIKAFFLKEKNNLELGVNA